LDNINLFLKSSKGNHILFNKTPPLTKDFIFFSGLEEKTLKQGFFKKSQATTQKKQKFFLNNFNGLTSY
jgi:hypothetical protein